MAVEIKKYKIDGNKLIVDLTPELKILLGATKKVKVGDLEDGETFDNGKYVVVEHFGEGRVGVVCHELAAHVRFGDTNNYDTSEVKQYINGTFFKDLKEEFTMNNLCYYSVNLETMDGSDCHGELQGVSASVMTFDQYRKYHKFIGNCDDPEWLSTARTGLRQNHQDVVVVDIDGRICFSCCTSTHAVRPYFELVASTLVDL